MSSPQPSGSSHEKEKKDLNFFARKKRRAKDDSLLLTKFGRISNVAYTRKIKATSISSEEEVQRPKWKRLWRPWLKRRESSLSAVASHNRRLSSLREQDEEREQESPEDLAPPSSSPAPTSPPPPRKSWFSRRSTLPATRRRTTIWFEEGERRFRSLSLDASLSVSTGRESSSRRSVVISEGPPMLCKCIQYRIMMLILCSLTLGIDVILIYHATMHFKNEKPQESTSIGRFVQVAVSVDGILTVSGLIGTIVSYESILGVWVYSRLPFALMWAMTLALLTPAGWSLGLVIFIVILTLLALIAFTCFIEIVGFRYLEHLSEVYDHERFPAPVTTDDEDDEMELSHLEKTTSSESKEEFELSYDGKDKQKGDGGPIIYPEESKPEDGEKKYHDNSEEKKKAEGDKLKDDKPKLSAFERKALGTDSKLPLDRKLSGIIEETSDDEAEIPVEKSTRHTKWIDEKLSQDIVTSPNQETSPRKKKRVRIKKDKTETKPSRSVKKKQAQGDRQKQKWKSSDDTKSSKKKKQRKGADKKNVL